MSKKPLAYVDDDGDLIVIDEHHSEIVVALQRIKTPAHIVHEMWRLTMKNNYKSEALLKAIEIMSEKIGYDAAKGGDWVNKV